MAYGAVLRGTAVSEGYAMAFKAMCEKIGIKCLTVVGRLDNIDHCWNIVRIDNKYYHVDVSVCDEKGLEEGFLKTDADLLGSYWWDTEEYPRCEENSENILENGEE